MADDNIDYDPMSEIDKMIADLGLMQDSNKTIAKPANDAKSLVADANKAAAAKGEPVITNKGTEGALVPAKSNKVATKTTVQQNIVSGLKKNAGLILGGVFLAGLLWTLASDKKRKK